jgi:hypothetical protein
MADLDIPLPFPTEGVDQLTPFEGQRPGTCVSALNVRGFEPGTLRPRGGARPGLQQYIHQQVNGSNWIQDIDSFVAVQALPNNPAFQWDLKGTVLSFVGGGGLPWAIYQAGALVATGGTAGDTPDAVSTDGTSFFVTTDHVTKTQAQILDRLPGKRTPRIESVTTGGVQNWSTDAMIVGVLTPQLPQSLGTIYTSFGPGIKIGSYVYFVNPGVGLFRITSSSGFVVDGYPGGQQAGIAPYNTPVPWLPTPALMADPAYEECGGAQGMAVAGNFIAIPVVKLSGGTYTYALVLIDTSKTIYAQDSFIDTYGTIIDNHTPNYFQALPITMGSETLTTPWTSSFASQTLNSPQIINNGCQIDQTLGPGNFNLTTGTYLNTRACTIQMQATFQGSASSLGLRLLDDDFHIPDDATDIILDANGSKFNMSITGATSISGTTTTNVTYNLNTLYFVEAVITSADNRHASITASLNPGGASLNFSIARATGAAFDAFMGFQFGLTGVNGTTGMERITFWQAFQTGMITRVNALATSSTFTPPAVLSDGTAFYWCLPGTTVKKITTGGSVSWTQNSIASGTSFNLATFPSGTSGTTANTVIIVTGAPGGTGVWITTGGSATSGTLGVPNSVSYIADLGFNGTGATAGAVIVGNAIQSITVNANGSGYTTTPNVYISPNAAGFGYGALATAALSGGGVATISVVTGGSGYSSGASVWIMSGLGGMYLSTPLYGVTNAYPTPGTNSTALANDSTLNNWSTTTFNQTGPIAVIAGGSAATQKALQDFQRTIILLAVAAGIVKIARNYTWYPVGDGTGVASPEAGCSAHHLSTTAPVIRSAPNGGLMYFVDGINFNTRGYGVKYDPTTNTVVKWLGTGGTPAGSFPQASDGSTPRLICTWNGRTVVAGIAGALQLWYMSRMADPNDWQTSPTSPSPDQAVAGANPPFNNITDTITALIPYSDQLMVFGGDHSIWLLTGDPGAGGRIQMISDELGVQWGSPWCKDPFGNLYFASSRTGIYRMIPGEQPVRISQQIEPFLINQAVDVTVCRLAWDEQLQGLHVFITSVLGAALQVHFFWEQRSNAWWPSQFGNNNHNPLVAHTFYGNNAADRVVLLGSWDGYVRAFNLGQTTDDGAPITSYVWIGPLVTKELDAILLKDFTAVLGTGSGSVTYGVYVGTSAQAAFAAGAVATGTLSAGRSYNVPVRYAGHAIYLQLSSTNPWALEAVRLRIQTQGKVQRRRGPGAP